MHVHCIRTRIPRNDIRPALMSVCAESRAYAWIPENYGTFCTFIRTKTKIDPVHERDTAFSHKNICSNHLRVPSCTLVVRHECLCVPAVCLDVHFNSLLTCTCIIMHSTYVANWFHDKMLSAAPATYEA
jgi:hypothetical protein